MKPLLEFYVTGLPKPAGSKRAFPIKRGGKLTGKVAVADACEKSRDWKCTVAHEAAAAMQDYGGGVFAGPVRLGLTFHLPRPKAHYGKHGLKACAPVYPTTKPDVLKLARGVEDALTGIIWNDDAQIVIERLEKNYTQGGPGCHIIVEEAA